MRCFLTCCSAIGLAVLLSPALSMAAGRAGAMRAPAGTIVPHNNGQTIMPAGGGMGGFSVSGGITAGTLTATSPVFSQSFTTPGGTNGSIFINPNGFSVTGGSTYQGQPTGTASASPALFIFGSGQTSSGLTGAELLLAASLTGSSQSSTGQSSGQMGSQSMSRRAGLTMGTMGAASFALPTGYPLYSGASGMSSAAGNGGGYSTGGDTSGAYDTAGGVTQGTDTNSYDMVLRR